MAHLAEVNRAYMGRIANDDSNVAVLVLVRIAAALGLRVGEPLVAAGVEGKFSPRRLLSRARLNTANARLGRGSVRIEPSGGHYAAIFLGVMLSISPWPHLNVGEVRSSPLYSPNA